MKITKLCFLVSLGSLIAVSCGNSGSKSGGGTKKFTSISGWKKNEKNGWFFSGKQSKEKGWPGMAFVQGGTFTMGLTKEDVMHDWNNTPTRMQVRSFWIGETEVTNYEYREYLTWLKYTFSPSNPNYSEIYKGALPDTLVWSNKLSRNDIYSEDYLRAAQFDYYPVVGVSWTQAQRYCEWLTDRSNEKALMNQGVINKDLYTQEGMSEGSNSFNVEKYKYNDPSLDGVIDNDKLAKKNGISNQNQKIVEVNRSAPGNVVTKFRLPTEAEWEYAAFTGSVDREYNLYKGKETATNNLRTKKGKNRGQMQANFKYGSGDYSGIGGWGNDGNAITSDVRAYPSDNLGVYGMLGNVAEWVQDVYRPIIDSEGNDFNYFRGNIYSEYITNGEDGFKKVEDGDIQYDTLADGRLVYRGLPGSLETKVVEDYRDYRDGDASSSIDEGGTYNSPVKRWIVDENGRIVLEKDSQMRTSEISNSIRVIKGGSWKDTSYWLDAGQRRFMDEGSSAVWIGFRVAQDHKGDESSSKKTKRGIAKAPR